MRPRKKGWREAMKAYVWMERTINLMTSGIMDRVRKTVVLTGIIQKIVLERAIATLATSEAKAAIKLRSQNTRKSLLT